MDKELQRLQQRLELITYFSQSVFRRNTVDDVLWDIVSNCITRLGFDDCVIYLVDDQRNVLVQKAAHGEKNLDDEVVLDPIEIQIGHGIVGTVAKTGIAENIRDTRKDDRYIVDDTFRLSELAVPIIVDGKVIGVIDSENESANFYDDYHLEILQDLANISGTKIEKTLNQEERSDLSIMHLENPNPIIRVSRDYDVMLSNKSASDIEASLSEMDREDVQEKLYDHIQRAFETGDTININFPCKDRIHSVAIVPFPDRGFANLYFVDITPIYEAKEEAERAYQAKTDFLSVMSHEIRTPLNGIINLNRLLKLKITDPGQLEHLETIEYSGENLLKIINDILDFEKLGAGKFIFYPNVFNIRDLMVKIENMMGPKAAEKTNTLDCSVHGQVPNWIKCDENRLVQVISNLVNNALKFTKDGKVSILVGCGPQNDNKADLKFSVKDSGRGIPAEKIETIFNSYEQIPSQPELGIEGAGLGLAIARRLVEQQGGNIKVRSKEGRGSEFTVILPVEIGIKPDTIDAEESGPDESRIAGSKILIVDDSPINVLAAKEYLVRWSADVLTAKDGAEAVETWKTNTVDLILMDLQMPVMNGYQASKEIRKSDNKNASVPIIAMSADVLTSSLKDAVEAGMNDHLSKPFDPNELFNVINSNLAA